MGDFKIVSDSSCDLSKGLLQEHEIDIVPYYFTLDGEKYFREGVDMDIAEFYRRIAVKGVYPKTSLPPIQDYIDVFKRQLEQGLDVLCVCLTAKFSGSVQSAFNAKNILLEEFPDSRIEIVDSANVSISQGMLVLEISKMKNAGLSLDEIIEKIELIKNDRIIAITFDTLEYLQKGGRIGKVTALAGSLFNIKPLILFDDGELIPHSKARGRKKALVETLDIFEKNLKGPRELYSYGMVDADCKEDAEEFLLLAKKRGFPIELPIMNIGVTITVHAGPKTIGIAALRKFETLS